MRDVSAWEPPTQRRTYVDERGLVQVQERPLEITDEMVDRAAYPILVASRLGSWRNATPMEREQARNVARAALTAAFNQEDHGDAA